MDKPKLRIEPKKFSGESAVLSLRLPRDMIKEFDRIAEVTGRTRNEVLSLSLEFALDSMELCGHAKDTEESDRENKREGNESGNY